MGGTASAEEEPLPPRVGKTKTVGANFASTIPAMEASTLETVTGFTSGSLILENPGRSITADYDVFHDKVLGEGGYGLVVLAEHKHTRAQRAIKQVNKAKVKDPAALKAEIDVMKMTDHPNIVKLYESYEDKKKIYLVMECCEGGELFDRIVDSGKLSEEDSAVVMRQLLRAVRYLHNIRMVHRDLKPENIIFVKKKGVAETPMKIIDFGLAEVIPEGQTRSECKGSSYYMAPETLAQKYGLEIDVWACGIILFILLTGTPPFYGNNDSETYKSIRRDPLRFDRDLWGGVSKEAQDFIRKMLRREIRTRITAAQATVDPWILKHSQVPKNLFAEPDLDRVLLWQAKTPRLAKAAMEVIVLRLSEKDIKPMKDLFLNIDVVDGGGGTISSDEIEVAAKAMPRAKVEQVMQEMGAAQMTYTEFLASAMDRERFLQQTHIQLAFDVFDRKGAGVLSADSLTEIFGPAAVEIVQDARAALGLAQDTRMSKEDFGRLLKMK